MTLTIILTVACALVLLESAVLFLHLGRLRRLGRLPVPEPAAWPSVSVVIAARDEARGIGRSITTRLADDYPNLEVILVDDRSTDGTGQIATEAAAGDPRFTLVRIDELPAGWLGKVHAMHQGAARATGEWILFSDGDVALRPGTMRAAVAHCLAEEIDLLALLPRFRSGNLLVDAILTVFLRGILVIIDPGAVRNPKSRVAAGSGGFNLVRRTLFDRTPGLEHLRLETGDDIALGLMVKQAGGRVELIDGSSHASVPLYRTVGEFVRGIEKNGSTTATIPLPLFAGLLVLLWSFVLTPLAALLAGPGWLRLLGALAVAVYTSGEIAVLWSNCRRWFPALLWPLGGLLMSFALVRSTWLAKRNGGVRWRGTFYSLEELAKGRRVAL